MSNKNMAYNGGLPRRFCVLEISRAQNWRGTIPWEPSPFFMRVYEKGWRQLFLSERDHLSVIIEKELDP